MAQVLTPGAIALIDRPVIGNLATVDSKNRAQVTPIWVDHDGDDIVVNTARGRVKANNIERNPYVGLSIVDPDDAYNTVVLRGKVTEITTNGADAHIDSLAKKYLGVDSYPMRREGEVRIKVRITPEHVMMQPAS